MKLPARKTLIACGVTLAVASGSIASIRLLADDRADTSPDASALSSDAVWLTGTQKVNTDGKGDRLALPNQAHWILRDQRTAPLEALVWADVIDAPQARAPQAAERSEPAEQPAPSATEDSAPAPVEQAPERTFAALTFEPVDEVAAVAGDGPMSILPSPGSTVSTASRTTVELGDGQPSATAVAFAPIPAPTAIIPSASEQNGRNLFQQPEGWSSTNRLDEWDIR